VALTRRELAALAVAFVISLPAVTPRIYASDEIQYFSYLRSLWFDRDVSFENEYQYFYQQNIGRGEGFHATFLEQYTDAGRRPSFATIGSALLWAPFYVAGDLAARASGAPADGFSRPYIAAVAYGSAFYGFAAMLLSMSAARRLAGPGIGAGALVLMGTPLLFYMYVSPPYSHACSAFAVALFVTVWLRVREEWSVGGTIALGLAGALMAMVREQDAILVIGPALDFGSWAIGSVSTDGRAGLSMIEPQRSIGSARGPSEARSASASETEARSRRARASGGGPPSPTVAAIGASILAAAGAFFVGLLPQLLAYKALNGHYGPSKLVTRKMTWTAPHALEVLGSPEHGFFVWTPLAAIAIVGLIILARRGTATARRVAICALAMVALQIYVSGSVESWTVAGAFGQRRFVALTIVLVIGLAAVIAAVGRTRWRTPVALLLALCVWWNVALIVEFGTGLMNRQRLEPRRNAYDAFVTLPRMAPSLVYRYLFDRESFYQPRRNP